MCHRFVQIENLGEKKPRRREQLVPNESVSWGHKTATEEIQQLETQRQTKKQLLLQEGATHEEKDKSSSHSAAW